MTLPLVNFVHGEIDRWVDVAADSGRELTVSELAPRIRLGREIWLVQAFQLLRQRGHNVRLSGTFDPQAINVAHCDDIKWQPDLWRSFVVSVRADRDPAFLSQLEIVQNQHSVWSRRDHFIPHWPQPGLIPRDVRRGQRLENVVYMGKADNLDSAFHSAKFHDSLRGMGMRLLIRENDWWDYRDADVVLAVRGGPRFYLAIKPATKLINAWLAGCPAILGPEPGYSELRRSNLDYLEASSPEDVIAALSTLKRSPDMVSHMIANGSRRAEEYTADRTVARWEQFLSITAAAAFSHWQAHASGHRHRLSHSVNLARRRIWGTWAVGCHRSRWTEALGLVRRIVILPRSIRAS